MTQAEKRDIILKKLYEFRDEDGQDAESFKDIHTIMQETTIYSNPTEAKRIAEQLIADQLVKPINSFFIWRIKITSKGIDYAEKSSYSQPNTSLITLNISGSYNQTVVGNNASQVQYNNSEALKLINNLIIDIRESKELSNEKKGAALDCMEDIESDIKSGKPVKKFKWDSLLANVANSSQLVSLFTQLGQIFGYFPIA